MAITILQSPDTISPAYNDIVFTVDSTNKAQCSFRYLCDIYVNGSYITRLKLFPFGSNGYASFKINRVLEDFVSHDLHANLYGTNIFAANNNTIKDYQLKFGEEYDSSPQCDAGTTIFPNLTTTSTFSFFNGAFQYKNYLTYASADYLMTGVTKKFLTNMPNRAYITYGDQMTFNFMNSGSVYKMQVITYNSTGTVLGTYRYNNVFSAVGSYNTRILTVGVGPENLNNSTLSLGVQPVIYSAVHRYTIQLLNNSNIPVSEIKEITMDNRIYEFTPHRLWWLNRLGGFDSYDYSMKDIRKVDSSRTEFTKLLGAYTGGDYTYNIGDRGRTVVRVDSQETNTYNSNWMTERESIWMEELFTSPEVYISDINTYVCFNQVNLVVNLFDEIEIEIPIQSTNTPPAIGDFIIVDFETDILYSGPYEVLEVTETAIIVAGPPDAVPGPIITEGTWIPSNFVSSLDPVIVKTTSYLEKIKYRTKNIQYNIEIDKAYGINTQRN